MNSQAHRFAKFSAVVLSACTVSAHAAFFQLQENSPAGLGNAFAGGAAIAEDASTVWYNPAGMSRLSGQEIVVGLYYIQPSSKFNKTSATVATGGTTTGGNGGDAGENAFIPNFYFTHKYDERWSFGIGVNVPFGLATDYDDDWVGRYHADRSEIKTININPAVSYRVNDSLSIGAGLNYQRIEAQLTQWVDFGLICATTACAGAVVGEAPQGQDGYANIEADDTSYGFNLGVLWEAMKETRFGLAYRSPIRHQLAGTQDISASGLAATISTLTGIVDTSASARVTLPAMVSISAHHQLTSQWAIMGDATQSRWHDLQELRIQFGSTQPNSVVTLNSKNAVRYSVGVSYVPDSTWIYRAGVAFDESPAPSAADRTPRLPDEDRTWFAFGLGYKMRDNFAVDFAFVHIKIDDAAINKSTTVSENASRGNLVGNYEADVNLLSAQARWMFK